MPANYWGNHYTPHLPVGSEPLGNARWGHSDLSGSMGEWTRDAYAFEWYETTVEGCVDCLSLNPAGMRLVRGGWWQGREHDIRAAIRVRTSPLSQTIQYGMRCARDP